MLYCRDCGQCSHISEDDFIQCDNTRGWETYYIDCDNREWTDSIDSEHTDTDPDYTECPKCQSNSIEFDSDVTLEEAQSRRAAWEQNQNEGRKREDREEQLLSISESEWDLSTNEVHN